MQSVAGGAVAFATMGVSIGVHRTVDAAFVILCVITLVAFATGLWYGMLKKSSFLLAIIPLGLIIIISAVLRKIADSQLMMLTTGLFIVLSVSAVIRFLVLLHKTDENG
jgi:hypothetical protein